jgi:hypothetical protein
MGLGIQWEWEPIKLSQYKQHTVKNILSFQLCFRKSLFDERPQDPDYTPLPEDRAGGFDWGERRPNQQWQIQEISYCWPYKLARDGDNVQIDNPPTYLINVWLYFMI